MPPPSRRPSPSSRYGASAKRAPTQHVTPVKSASQRTTVKKAAPIPSSSAAPVADPTPTQNELPSAAPSAASTPGPAPATSRHASSSRRTASATRGARTDAARGTRPESSKSARGAQVSGRAEKEPSGRRPRTRSNRAMYIVAAVVVLAVIGAVSWKPYERSTRVSSMDAARSDPAKMDAAMKAADEYLGLVDNDPDRVRELVLNLHGPVAVQVHLAKTLGMYPLLVSISDRSNLTPEERALTLRAAAAVYSPDKHASERLPSGLEEVIDDPASPDEVAAASLELIGKAAREDAVLTLLRVAASPHARPARADAALSAMAPLIDSRTCAQALSLFTGPGEPRALANAAFCTAVTSNCSGLLDQLIPLAFGKDEAVHPFGLACLGHCQLPDTAASQAKREDLSKRIAPLLVKTTPPEALSAAVRACSSLALTPTTDALIALAPDIDALALPNQVTSDFLSHTLGESFILTASEADKKTSDGVVQKLTAALAAAETRPVAAKALQLITNGDLPSMRAALDQLAAVGDQASIGALKTILVRAYQRDDVVKTAGDDANAWKAYLDQEHTVSNRVNEIEAWRKTNGKFNRIADGAEKLQASKDFIAKAVTDVTGWLNNGSFLPPLGKTRGDIETLLKNINMLGSDVKRALVGAQQQSGGAVEQAPAAAAPQDATQPP